MSKSTSTAHIDHLIAKKEKQIQKLNDEKSKLGLARKRILFNLIKVGDRVEKGFRLEGRVTELTRTTITIKWDRKSESEYNIEEIFSSLRRV